MLRGRQDCYNVCRRKYQVVADEAVPIAVISVQEHVPFVILNSHTVDQGFIYLHIPRTTPGNTRAAISCGRDQRVFRHVLDICCAILGPALRCARDADTRDWIPIVAPERTPYNESMAQWTVCRLAGVENFDRGYRNFPNRRVWRVLVRVVALHLNHHPSGADKVA
jgi:hypothetical protein